MSPNNLNKKKPFGFSLFWMYGLIILFIFGVYYLDDNVVTKEVSYSEFEKYVSEDHGITKIIVFTDKKEAEGFLSDSLASKLFHQNSYKPGDGKSATVITDIPSADKLDSKIDEWRATGAFSG